jgi:hypothetical protein
MPDAPEDFTAEAKAELQAAVERFKRSPSGRAVQAIGSRLVGANKQGRKLNQHDIGGMFRELADIIEDPDTWQAPSK